MGISLGHLIVILVIVLVLFGAGKLPSVMSEFAKGIKAFKKGMEEEKEPKRINNTKKSKPVQKKSPKKSLIKK